MRGVVVAVEKYEVSTFCAKKCFFSKVQIHKNHNSLKKYHSKMFGTSRRESSKKKHDHTTLSGKYFKRNAN